MSRWSLSVIPREEWKQMFAEAWRLERDYFYDRGMHGVPQLGSQHGDRRAARAAPDRVDLGKPTRGRGAFRWRYPVPDLPRHGLQRDHSVENEGRSQPGGTVVPGRNSDRVL